MAEQKPAARTCPNCGSGDYAFRGRREVTPENGDGKAMVTRYVCKKCKHGWNVLVPLDANGGAAA
jgi:DNA-directed RNA polymerase subunit M/transcription elongation factor TFIIS